MTGAIDIVLQHWLSLRRNGLAPDRMNLCPVAISAALPHVAIIEVPSMLVRLTGSALEPWMERSCSSRSATLADAFPGDGRIAEIGARLWEGQRGLLVAIGRHGKPVRLLALPLTMPMSDGHPRAIVAIDAAVAVPVQTIPPAPSARRLQVIAGGRA